MDDHFKLEADSADTTLPAHAAEDAPDTEGLFADAWEQIEKKRWKSAASLLARILKLDPECGAAFSALGFVRFRQQRLDDAINQLNRAVEIDPSDSLANVTIPKVLFGLGDLAAAHEALLDLEPPEEEATRISELFVKANEAVDTITAAGFDIATPRKELAVQIYREACTLFTEDRVDEAVALFDVASLLKPDYTDPRFDIGTTVETYHRLLPSGEYLGCAALLKGLHFHDEFLRFCCTAHSGGKGWAKIVKFDGGSLPLDAVLAKRLKIVRDLNSGVETECTGCHQLESKEWVTEDALFDYLIINSYSVCNFRCTYCSLTHRNFEMPAYYYATEKVFSELVENDWLSPASVIVWGGGDPCVSKEFQAATQRFTDHGCTTRVNTNASISVPAIKDALSKGQCHVDISIDAGSKSAFYRVKMNRKTDSNTPITVKSKEVYSAVWDTVAEYASIDPESVRLKYIFIEENSAISEVKLFIDMCKKSQVKYVMFTPESAFMQKAPLQAEVLPPMIFEAMKFAAEYATASGLDVYYYEFFPAELFRPS